ncbi:hypothetical protein IBT49_23585 [Erwinia sp. S63]|uniref:hypothetical protein n=1 Tax=Erwinia sp. S63 TaxID=2769341 RepID=UPI00190AFE5B|nr:hypothetical protein [Erwinia sp. S63]MBK0098983.1 hypothetical protein [Erwinia sp. S63]
MRWGWCDGVKDGAVALGMVQWRWGWCSGVRDGAVGQDDRADRKDGINHPWASALAIHGEGRFAPLPGRPALLHIVRADSLCEMTSKAQLL